MANNKSIEKTFTFKKGEDMRIRTRAYQVRFGIGLMGRIGAVAGGGFGAAISSFIGGDDINVDDAEALIGDNLGDALGSIFKRLDEIGVDTLVGDILSTTDIHNGTTWVSIDLDRDFVRRYFAIGKIGLFVLKWQYEDFFSELSGGEIENEEPPNLDPESPKE